MKINLIHQNENHTCPPLPVCVFTGSALPVTLVGINQRQGDGEVVAVRVKVTNADGVQFTAPASKVADAWETAFASSCFVHFGSVKKGFLVEIDLKRQAGAVVSVTFAVADLVVDAASPSAEPGDPLIGYVRKGDDIYVKTAMIDDVQHFAKQKMVYSERQHAWGADWIGDYIIIGGEYVPANVED